MPIYMQIDNIPGSVTAQGYNGWIELKSIDFGADRPITTKPGYVSDRESSKPNINEIAITKALDKTSPNLFSEACSGTGKTVKISICNTGSSAYLELTLSKTLISKYKVSSVNGESTVQHNEEIGLNFEKIEVRYTPYGPDGDSGSPVATGYDLSTATKV